MPKLFLLILVLLFHPVLHAQEFISLNSAIERVLSTNQDLKMQDVEVKIAEADLKKINSAWLPQLSLSHTLFATDDPLNSFGFKLQEERIAQKDFDPVYLNNPEFNIHNNTKLSLRQSLFNYQVFENKRALQARKLGVDFQRMRVSEKLVLETKNTYSDLQLLYATLDLSNETLKTLQEKERVVRQLQEQGLVKTSDGMFVQMELTDLNLKIQEITLHIKDLSKYLSLLMGESADVVYRPESLLSEQAPNGSDLILKNRSDMKAAMSFIDSRKHGLLAEKYGFIPSLHVFGELNFYDKNIFSFSSRSIFTGIQLSWDLFNGNLRAYEKARLDLEIKRDELSLDRGMDQAKLEISKLRNQIELFKSRILLTEENVKWAEESGRILNDRFLQGLEKTVEVMSADNLIFEKKLKLLEAISNLNKAMYQLDYLNAGSK